MELINKTLGCCRLVYNMALETKQYAYKSHGIGLSAFDLINQLPDLKEGFPFLKVVNAHSLQSSIRNMEKAYINMYKNGFGYPKFKRKHNRESFQCPDGIRRINFEKSLITLPKIKNIPIVIDRNFNGQIKTVTVCKTPSGKFYVSVLVDTGADLPKKKTISNSIGIDMGITTFATLSDGTEIENLRFYKKQQERLAIAQYKLSLKKKGSNNRGKQRVRVARIHEKIANQRKDYLHKWSDAITKQYDTICVENLNIKGMSSTVKPKQDEDGNYLPNGQSAKSGLNKSILDVGWGMFINMLEYKSSWRGCNFVKVDRFYPSSKTCNNCGNINKDLKLKDRVWICNTCSKEHLRDENASKNINIEGVRLLRQKQNEIENIVQSGRGSSVEPVGIEAGSSDESSDTCLSNTFC